MLPETILPVLARMTDDGWVVMCSVAVVAIVCGSVRSMVIAANREKSRREIAAYIAEGSMTPEQGENLMAAGHPVRGERA